jgi:hypothetical protein
MILRTEPHEPRAGRYYTIERRIEGAVTQQWSKFLPDYSPLTARPSVDHGSSRAA